MKHFLITTIHNRATRWPYIKGHLDMHGIDYSVVLATDWRMFEHTTLNQAQLKQQSLTLAYYQIAQTALFEELEQYAVMEDDISLSEVPDYSLIPSDADLVYLTQTEHNKGAFTRPHCSDYSRVIDNWWETPYTLWSGLFAEQFSQYIAGKLKHGLWLGHIDHELIKMNRTGGFKMYGAVRNIANGLSSVRHLAPESMSFEGSISEDINVTN